MERIAERLGYCDPYAFAAQFKRFMGMAPGRLRRLNRTPGAME
jgi:AraC-like DNA-binding protein